MSLPARICLLGATGSIGESAIAVAAGLEAPIHTVTAHRRAAELAAIAIRCGARRAVVADPDRLDELRSHLAGHPQIEAAAGPAALVEAAGDDACDAVLTAVVGAAGLEATLAAVRAGKRVCIANKEPLVMAGELIVAAARESGATILPVDSEHSAIFQCLEGHRGDEVARLVLTASGGPFRERRDLSRVTVDEALRHPNWDMGPKITVDSATLMNKALEVIEARWLFDVEEDRIDVLIHPQSIVHSMVAYRDGSTMAQLGLPDMRTPIQYSLTWPEHRASTVRAPDLAEIASLTFEEVDGDRFPSIGIARAAVRAGGVAPAVINAANEVAVARFLAGEIPFTAIFERVAAALERAPRGGGDDLAAIVAADAATRREMEPQR